jgi:hypothetical protein
MFGIAKKSVAHAPPSIPELHSVSSSTIPAQFIPEGPSPYFQSNHFPSFQNMPTNGFGGPSNMFAAPFHFSAGLGSTPPSFPFYPPFSQLPPSTQQMSQHAAQNPNAHTSQREAAKDVSSPVNSPNNTTPPVLPQSTQIPHQTLVPSGNSTSHSHLQPHVHPPSSCINDQTQYVYLQNLTNGKWDTTPQGNWSLDVSHSQYQETDRLAVDWACRPSAGKQRNGASKTSLALESGYRTYRQCLGTIRCSNGECAVTIRPHTHAGSAITKQLSKSCKCGNEDLIHYPCPNKSSIIQWSGGVRYMNGIHDHNHEIPSYKLHLTNDQETEFTEFV